MIQSSKTYIKDLDISLNHTIGIENLKNKSILITGATGTIGSYIADMLLRYNQVQKANISICLAGRDINKLMIQFGYWNDPYLRCVKYDVMGIINFDVTPYYIIHTAGNAHPVAFNSDPVGTILGNVLGTYNLLEFGRLHGSKRLLYVSSGEIYGQGDLSVKEYEESYSGYIDISSSRACYPSSKRTAENLCVSYTKQHGFETVIVRPCHTFGPQFLPTDSRANVQFIRNVLDKKDIVMKSPGTQFRSYNYVGDCASAILTILFNGKVGEAYNAANPKIRLTIAELASTIAKMTNRNVVYEEPALIDLSNRTPISKQILSSKKLELLGWKSAFSAEEGIKHTIDILQGK